ncbi:MAG: FAD:protein FMN transferase [Candidatus Omnitrophica bacterium]|nr:FAD:protein FMN transferase [Candidatus Omnitrophota bacterium]
MRKILLSILIIAIITVGAFWIMRGSQAAPEQQRRVMMTTYVTIYAYGSKPAVSKAIDQAFQRMQEVADKFNAHNPDSPLYAFNQNGTPIKDKEILRVIKIAQDISKQSDGAFDITVYPLVKLWGFYGEDSGQIPPADKITEALSRIGYKHLILANGQLKRDNENILIDLGGIAKGYVVGQGIQALKKAGVNSAIIQAGGDIYALGHKKEKPWKIGIRHPRKEGILGYLEVVDQAVMGSGDYERFFIKGSKRYNHIIDPKTGYPAKEAIGVTVIYPDPAVADAWGPALSILGPDGLKIVEKIPGMEAIIVTGSGKLLYTSGLARLLNTYDKNEN